LRVTWKTIVISLTMAASAAHPWRATIAQESFVKIAHVRTVPLQDSASGIAWSQDGAELAAIHDHGGAISVWDANGNLLRTLRRDETLGPYNGPIAFLGSGHSLLAPAPTNIPMRQKSALALWNVDTGEIERTIPGPSSEDDPRGNGPVTFALSPDGTRVATYPLNRDAISIYSTGDWRLIAQRRITRADLPLDHYNDKSPPETVQMVTSLAWSAQNLLAVGLVNGVALVAPSPDSPIVGFIPSVDAYNTGRQVSSLSFSPNGRLLALGVSLPMDDYARRRAQESGSEAEEQENDLAYLKIWDVEAKRFIAYDPAIAAPRDLGWSSDGRCLLAVTIDEHLRVYWPSEHGGTPRIDFKLDGKPTMVRFSSIAGEWSVLIDAIGRPPAIQIYKITN
jgi:WD40 repeat protein